MTEQTRYRVTGGVFLIAVAFIVLPMLFDGKGLEPLQLQPMDRDYRADRSEFTAAAPPELEPLVEPDILSEAEALRRAVDAEGYLSGTGTRIGDPVLTRDPPGQGAEAPSAAVADGAWAVQLASFGQRANAVALRDRLRADGYQAVLSDARQGSVSSTRVAIGPILSRDDAVSLQHELSERYRLAPIVVEFSP